MCGLECVSGVMDVWFGVCVRCDGCVVLECVRCTRWEMCAMCENTST